MGLLKFGTQLIAIAFLTTVAFFVGQHSSRGELGQVCPPCPVVAQTAFHRSFASPPAATQTVPPPAATVPATPRAPSPTTGAPAATGLEPIDYHVVQTPERGPLPEALRNNSDPVAPEIDLATAALSPGERVLITTTSCGANGTDELVVWFKSILLFGGESLEQALQMYEFHLFLDEPTNLEFYNVIRHWKLASGTPVLSLANLKIYTPATPSGIWQMYRPCSMSRLFLPQLLPKIDRILYLDRDIVVLQDLRPLWAQGRRFSEKQMVAVGLETVPPSRSFYRVRRSAINPWGLAGLNSGVILFDLAKMREAHTNETFLSLNRERIKLCTQGVWCLGDQDVLNRWLHDNPAFVVPLGCAWNFRSDCTAANRISILHCNRQSQRSKAGVFPALVWEAVLQWPILSVQRDFVKRSIAYNRLFALEAAATGRYRNEW